MRVPLNSQGERVLVRRSTRGLGIDDLGCKVGDASNQRVGGGEVGAIGEFRDPEIQHHDTVDLVGIRVARHNDVGGLDVSVDHRCEIVDRITGDGLTGIACSDESVSV